MVHRGRDLLDAFRDSATYRLDPLASPAGAAILGASPEDRAAVLVAAVRFQVEVQRRLASGSARAVVDRDLGAFGALQRERGELEAPARAVQALISTLANGGEAWSDADVGALVEALDGFDSWSFGGLDHVPIEALARLVLRSVNGRRPPAALSQAIDGLARRRLDEGGPAEARRAAVVLAQAVRGACGEGGAAALLIDGDDDWGAAALAELRTLGDRTSGWIALLEHARTSTASKPARRWLARAREHLDVLGEEEFLALARSLLGALGAPASGEMRRGAGIGALAGLDHLPRAVPTPDNATLLRGLAWTCSLGGNDEVAALVAAAARECSKKLPDVGARCPKVVNACLWTLGTMGEAGAAHLVAFSQKARKPAARARADGALDRAAQAAGTSRAMLEDLAVPTHGLERGPLLLRAAGAACEAMVAAPGRVVVTWRSEDGQPLERAPRRAATPRPIVELRATVATQRRRLERLLASGARWPWSRFRDTVLGHPVVSSIVSCLIVELDGCEAFLPALGPPEPAPADVATVRLWHPAGKRVEEVIAWRDLLERERITQPFKQAHREVYLVTDQERADGYSSRRFAGHVVRQHALAELCSARGWSYRLRGPFDPGANTAPTLRIPHARLAAQFDVEPLEDHRLQSGHGIFLYVRTGTLRFSSAPEPSRRRSRITDLASMHGYPRGQAGEPVALESVAPIDLSEVMRDLDLFVSVAGVAADPQWPTTVPDPWPEVWREHAYGELSPLGERRREMLARIVPALPSADRLELQDRFLLVKGNRHRYRIHLGSANVLREPGSRHLCIVPAGSGLRPGDPGHVWLPFEGDDILAQIISKALLLADDDNIADPTIRTQIDAA